MEFSAPRWRSMKGSSCPPGPWRTLSGRTTMIMPAWVGGTTYLDSDNAGIDTLAQYNAAILTFDVTLDSYATGFEIDYQFGSEEYPDYVGSRFNGRVRLLPVGARRQRHGKYRPGAARREMYASTISISARSDAPMTARRRILASRPSTRTMAMSRHCPGPARPGRDCPGLSRSRANIMVSRPN